jgi:hypothetical protein
MNPAVGTAEVHIEHRTASIPNSNHPEQQPSKEKTMSDQQDRKLQHTDEQKPVSEKKSGNQQKQENPSGQPKSPRSEQEKHDQEKKKQA